MPKDGKLTHGFRRSAIMRFFFDGYAMKPAATLAACAAAAFLPACLPPMQAPRTCNCNGVRIAPAPKQKGLHRCKPLGR
jgi:hypothetical protein